MITLKRLALLAAALALTLAACAPQATPTAVDSKTDDVTTSGAGDFFADGEEAAPAEAPAPAGGEAAAPRLVIKNATLSLVVVDPAAAVTSISNLASSLGGFVVSSYTYEASVDAAGNTITQANLTTPHPSLARCQSAPSR